MNSKKRNLKERYPKIVGFYSISENAEFVEDISQLRFLRDLAKTELPFDLNGVISRPRTFGPIAFDSLQRFLAENKGFLDAERGIPFICTKKTLQDLCTSDDLNISACFHQGSIYLRSANCRSTYSHAKMRSFNKTAKGSENPFPMRKDTGPWAWGLNFKQLMVSGKQFKIIFKTIIDIVQGSRVGCFYSSPVDEFTVGTDLFPFQPRLTD